MREHDRAPLQRPSRRVGGRGGRRHRRVLRGHNARGLGLQEEVAEQAQGRGQAFRQAQHRHRSKCPSKAQLPN